MQELSQYDEKGGNVFLPLTFFGEDTDEKLINCNTSSLNINCNKKHIFIGTEKNDRTDDIKSCIENNGEYNIIFKNEPNRPYPYKKNVNVEYPFFDKDIKQSHLYIGVKAGEKISYEIDHAKKSIKILSPFFGEKQIGQLIRVCL